MNEELLTKENITIIEKSTMREAIKECLKDGGIPASLEEINYLIRNNIIPKQYYDTRTTNFNYELRDLTREELEDIEKLYAEGGRLLYLSLTYGGLYGDSGLGGGGRFVRVGVGDAKQTKAQKNKIIKDKIKALQNKHKEVEKEGLKTLQKLTKEIKQLQKKLVI